MAAYEPPDRLVTFPQGASPAGLHPASENDRHELYLFCDDLPATTAVLEAKGVLFGPISEQRWGILITVQLPGGGSIGLYQFRHPTAIGLK